MTTRIMGCPRHIGRHMVLGLVMQAPLSLFDAMMESTSGTDTSPCGLHWRVQAAVCLLALAVYLASNCWRSTSWQPPKDTACQ
jgi:hypothetical protein